MKLVFALLRPVYLRYFDSTIRLLAERGHTVHLSFSGSATVEEDLDRAKALTAYPEISLDIGPTAEPGDPRRLVAEGARLLGDFGRFLGPPYRNATALRRRAERVLRDALCSHAFPAVLRAPSSSLVAWLAAHPSAVSSRALVGLSRQVDRLLPADRRFVDYLRTHSPDAVLVSPVVDFGSDQVEYLKAARRLGVPTAVCVASWDNLTSKGLLRGNPDAVFVWNELQRWEAVQYHGLDPRRVVATGAPRFDEWFDRRPRTSAAAFRLRIGLEPTLRHVVYLCSSAFAAGDEVGFVKRWAAAIRTTFPEPAPLGILVRPHPQNARQWSNADLGGIANAVVWPRHGADPVDEDSRADFYDSIAHSAAVVGRNTSAQIEACIIGKPVLTILESGSSSGQVGTLHFHYLRRERGGFLIEASTIDQHLNQLCAVLDGGLEDADCSARFLKSFVRPLGLDCSATLALVENLERLPRCL
jgi:hypothetical protein